MKQTTADVGGSGNDGGAALVAACGKALEQISQTKAVILAEWSRVLQTQRHALRLALNEAAALARQTMYPHLLFPALALEKVQSVAAWNARQQSPRRRI